MHRFFVPPECIERGIVILPSTVSRQLTRVLRARPGDRIVALDHTGWEYTVVLDSIGPDLVSGSVETRAPAQGEPIVLITLYQGVLKTDRFELVLQKGTELGVSRFVPVFCARSVPRQQDRDWANKRSARWSRIITEAAEQSHRGKIPELDAPMDFVMACQNADAFALIPWEEDRSTGLRTVLWPHTSTHDRIPSISVFIGPEGGFTPEEVTLAEANGIVPVTLGRRILRSETAGIATVAAILYELGELGG